MGRLPFYSRLSEKDEYFFSGSKCIETKRDFDVFWQRLHDLNDKEIYRFRGCSGARFKLFSSSQRFWIEKELSRQKILYHDFIRKLVSETIGWQKETITRYFAQSGSSNNMLAFLSFMQHYGLPTPLIDFTADPFTALYFAVENPRFSSEDEEIENFCSLYIVNKTNAYFADAIRRFDEDISRDPNGTIDYDRDLLSYPILFVSTDNAAYKVLNNLNILNQKGVFFFNSNPVQPIEEVYKETLDEIKEAFGEKRFKQRNYEGKFAECVNIHKNLRHYILSKLESKGITEHFIFPNLERLSEIALSRALSGI